MSLALPLFVDLLQAWYTQLLGAPQAAGPEKWSRPCRTVGTWGPHLSVSPLHVAAAPGLGHCGPVTLHR